MVSGSVLIAMSLIIMAFMSTVTGFHVAELGIIIGPAFLVIGIVRIFKQLLVKRSRANRRIKGTR